MNFDDIQAVKKLLSEPQKILIVPHKNPDGDAIGSTLALWHYLRNRGQEATVIVPNDYPKFLKWMSGNEYILNFERENTQAKSKIDAATLIFTLDFNHLGRVAQMEEPLRKSTVPFVMIDHHQEPSDYATVMYSDPSMSSTCEMVYNFIEYLGDTQAITPEMASCLYTGIMTDTGSFKYASTTAQTHRVAAQLIEKGAESSEIHHRVFDTNTPGRLHLLGTALNNMVILEDYKTAYITLSQEELDAHTYQKGDTEGFVNYGLTLEGIIFAAIFIENRDEGIIKISFRSVGDFSVNEFARNHFGGGGHNNAAGGKSDRSLQETAAYFKSLLADYSEKLI
ncbi:bifunctional oligoribonuclease/PAP phosphatase NrnA [Pricia sp. S334]|uniref:Bifunctional oligoribonuclease/PAP phosphatase NrnA n=1 Tax=Pricia mediterranea TaxID=3076079 RepID=A0ABU3L9J7_9FLAO|nr:bifunctional oligoribonuclease/PAP phosphatase NrnA [Pricia sp. S334]MDT7829981.1 bifunctional oligoribonuclease/PAP phosphatase NrnA [Pricia sp. S334]